MSLSGATAAAAAGAAATVGADVSQLGLRYRNYEDFTRWWFSTARLSSDLFSSPLLAPDRVLAQIPNPFVSLRREADALFPATDPATDAAGIRFSRWFC